MESPTAVWMTGGDSRAGSVGAPARQVLARAIEPYGVVVGHGRNEVIEACGSPTDWHVVHSGVVARCAFLADGRRQILQLLFRDDFFGLASRPDRSCSVVISPEARTLGYRREVIEALIDERPELRRALRDVLFEMNDRLNARVFHLGRLRAIERIRVFLLEAAMRFADVESTEAIELPLSRVDIADYLGLSMETVSRSLMAVARESHVRFAGPHRIYVSNLDALRVE